MVRNPASSRGQIHDISSKSCNLLCTHRGGLQPTRARLGGFRKSTGSRGSETRESDYLNRPLDSSGPQLVGMIYYSLRDGLLNSRQDPPRP